MPAVPQELMDIIIIAGITLILALVVRHALQSRRIVALLDEQSHTIQKLSAEVFEMQNVHTEAIRNVAPLAQSCMRLENELQAISAAISSIRSSSPAPSPESMQQFGKEIRRVLQAKEVTDFLDRQGKN